MKEYSKKVSVKKILFWTTSWIGSMFLFAFIFVNKGLVSNMSTIEVLFLTFVTTFGIVSFVIAILDIERVIRQNNDWLISSVLSVLVFILSLGLGISILIFAFYILPKPQNSKIQTDTKNDTSIQIPERVDTSFVQTSTNSNSNVNCNVHANCGGGYKNISRNECDNSICCEVGGKWYFYTDKNKCNQDQQAYNDSQNRTTNANTTSNSNSSSATTVPTPYTFHISPTQNTSNQTTTSNNTSLREQCISNINSLLTSKIRNINNLCEGLKITGTKTCQDDLDAANSWASDNIAKCNAMYP